jgi:hypothetical protein
MGSNQSSLAKEIKENNVLDMEQKPCFGVRGLKAQEEESSIVETESVIDSEEEEEEGQLLALEQLVIATNPLPIAKT